MQYDLSTQEVTFCLPAQEAGNLDGKSLGLWRLRSARQIQPQVSRPLAASTSRQLLQSASAVPGLYVEAFAKYGSSKGGALPIPTTAQPSRCLSPQSVHVVALRARDVGALEAEQP